MCIEPNASPCLDIGISDSTQTPVGSELMVAADNKDHRPESRINLQKALESYTHTTSFDNDCKDLPPIRPRLGRKALGYGRGGPRGKP